MSDKKVTATESMKASHSLSKGSKYLDSDLAKKQAQIVLDEQSKDKKK